MSFRNQAQATMAQNLPKNVISAPEMIVRLVTKSFTQCSVWGVRPRVNGYPDLWWKVTKNFNGPGLLQQWHSECGADWICQWQRHNMFCQEMPHIPDVGILHCGELPHHRMGIKVSNYFSSPRPSSNNTDLTESPKEALEPQGLTLSTNKSR